MDYYTEKQRANLRIYNMIETGRKNRTDLKVKDIIFDVTQSFKVGEKSVMNRINLIKDVDEDFEIIDGIIVFKNG